MAKHGYLILFLFAILTQFFCDATYEAPNLLRGHKQPFGYQMHKYHRIRTIYNNPHPEEFYAEYFRKSQPVIIRGGAITWPAVKKWDNLTYIAEQSGNHLNLVAWKRGLSHDKYHPTIVEMTMKEFTEQFENKTLYLDATVPLGIQKDVYWPEVVNCRFYTRRLKQLAVLFNNGKSASDIHLDTTETFFVQITGRRQWLIIHPDYSQYLHGGAAHLPYHGGISVMDQKSIDMEKYGDLFKGEIYGGMLYPGDIIFVPESWYHQVNTKGSPNMAVVAFFHYLRCSLYDFNSLEAVEDSLQYCLRFLETKPLKLKCQPLKTNLTSDQINPYLGELNREALTPPAHKGSIGSDVEKEFIHDLNSGSQLYPLGVDLTDLGKSLEEMGAIILQALRNGFKMFTVKAGDVSEEAVRKYVKYEARLMRKKYRTILIIPFDKFGKEETTKALNNSLQRMNTTFINAVIMEAPYCKVSNTSTCTRNDLNDKWRETWKVMEDYKRQNKIISLGVSDFSIEEIQTLMTDAKETISIVRGRFDVFYRNTALRKYAKTLDAVFMGHSVNGEGWTKYDGLTFNPALNNFAVHALSYKNRCSLNAAIYFYTIRKRVLVFAREFSDDDIRVAWVALSTGETDLVTDQLVVQIENLVKDDDHEIVLLNIPKDDLKARSRTSSEEDDGATHRTEKPYDHTNSTPDTIVDSYTLLFQSIGRRIIDKREVKFNYKNYSNEFYTDDKDFESPLHGD